MQPPRMFIALRAGPHARLRRIILAIAPTALLVTGCGGSRDAAGAAVRVPARSGEVWEIDRAADRATAPAALLAFVNGVHVMVLDGDDTFAGMRALSSTRENGVQTLQLADGVDAQLVPAGANFELHFSTGERVPLHKQTPRKERTP